MAYNLAGGGTYFLNGSISSTATSITLSSFTEPVSGTPYTMALLNTEIVYGTIAPKTTSSEFISFTGITQNVDGTATLTGVTRGLAKKYPFTASSTFRLPHSGQSQFILSDAPQVFNQYAALENDNVFLGSNTVPTPVVDGNPATKAYVDSVVGGVTTTPRLVVTGTAGETITVDQLVYLKASDGKWWLCDADTAATVDNVTLGLAQGGGSADGNISGGVLIQGLATLTAFTVTAGTKYYASNTAGGISTSAGTTEVTIGEVPAGSTTTINFLPRFDQQVTENELDAMAGGGDYGTPSTSNKFITQSYVAATATNPIVRTYPTAGSPATWTKPAGLKYVVAEVQAGGGNGSAGADGGANGSGGAGGGGGGYARKIIAAADLGSTETVTTGAATAASSFGAHVTATAGGNASGITGGVGGIGTAGNVLLEGGDGNGASADTLVDGIAGGGIGGSSHLGGGGKGSTNISVAGSVGNLYGGGGGGGAGSSGGFESGGAGAAGFVIVTEYYI